MLAREGARADLARNCLIVARDSFRPDYIILAGGIMHKAVRKYRGIYACNVINSVYLVQHPTETGLFSARMEM